MMGPLILIVDDNEASRYARMRTLSEAGYRVLGAADGEDGLRIAREERPQVVLCDIGLPDLDGRELCRRLRLGEEGFYTPVAHISASHTSERDKEDSLDSGADIFLAEPVEPQELITVVRTLARLRRTEAGLARSEARMRLATEGAGIATWDIDLRTGAAVWNRQLYLMLGYDPNGAQPATWERWKDRIDPADLPAVLADMEQAQKDGSLFSREHRVRRAGGGDERWLAPFGRVHQDEAGADTRFIGIVLDVTARKRMEAEREDVLRLEREARARAEEMTRLQDEFLATLSHELRTPLSAVLGWVQLARKGRLTEGKSAEALEIIERNAKLQTELINDLLDVPRIITGQMELESAPLPVEAVLRRAVDALRPQAAEKGIEIVTRFAPADPVNADADRLQQVFSNLVLNAVKFTPRGGRVECRVDQQGEFVRIVIADTGEGIASDMLASIFQRFRQADGSRTRRHGGLGLGLTIVRHLVEAHGGQVWATSEGKGKGSTFTVLLPAVSAQVTATPPERSPGAPAGSDGTLRLSGIRALVVDDEKDSRELLERLVSDEGAIVHTASGAAEATAIFQRWLPDVLLLDIGMPDTDGYELLQMLRKSTAAAARLPAVAITGYARPGDRDRALSVGFQAHFAKPFEVDQLVRLVAAVARGARAEPPV